MKRRKGDITHTPIPWRHPKKSISVLQGTDELTVKICDTFGVLGGIHGAIPVRVQVANAEFIVLAVNAHDKLLAAINMVFEAADDGGNMNDIDWDMLRDAYNLGLKGEA